VLECDFRCEEPDIEPDTISLTISRCGEYQAVFDPDVEDLVRQYRWSLHRPHKHTKKVYARAERCPVTKNKLRLYMHRLLCEHYKGPPPSPKHVADHRDGNGLNNRAHNLRWWLPTQNSWILARGEANRLGL
jgi:hypothetical protein